MSAGKRRKRRSGQPPSAPTPSQPVKQLKDPYVVRFGPWARNLYLGLPAASAFGLISFVTEMSGAFGVAWNLFVAALALFCAFPRETRFYRDGTVVVLWRFLALIPVWGRRYQRAALKRLRVEGGSFSFVGEAEVSAGTVWLVLHTGRRVAVQSYSAGADNQPPLRELVRNLGQITGLRVV